MSFLLGIDIGTSGTKTCLFREDGDLVSSALAEYPMYQPKPGWAEQHPEDWWQAVRESVGRILSETGISGKEIRGIGLSGQMHGLVLLDREGKVLRPAIIWCDQRTEAQAKGMEERIGRERIIEYTANPPLPNFTAVKLMWVKEREPEVFGRIHRVLLPKDYIRYKLTGEFATEVSDASGTLLLDVANRKWSGEMIRHLGIQRDWLPRLYESHEVTGTVHAPGAEATGLAAGTPVVGGGGDQAAGAVGNGIVRPGVVSAVIGTSGVVFAFSEQVKVDAGGRLHTFCHAVPGKWHVMGVTQAAGGSLQWFRNQFGDAERNVADLLNKDPYELFSEQAALVEPGSEGLLFLPYLMGERTPHLDPAAKGVFFGITSRHRKNHFIRAVMEGVAYSLADSLSILRELGLKVSEVRVSGGGARSPLWRQIIADVFGCDVYSVRANEGPAFGAALLAGVGTGLFASVEEACEQTIRVEEKSHPLGENRAVYDRYYRLYRKLYQDLKEDFRLVHRLVVDQHHAE